MRVSVNKLDLVPKRIMPGLVGVFSVRSKRRDQYLSEECQGESFTVSKRSAGFLKGCARGASKGERTEEPAAKALVFRFLRSLTVRRMLLTTPENTITYHNALCLSPKNFA